MRVKTAKLAGPLAKEVLNCAGALCVGGCTDSPTTAGGVQSRRRDGMRNAVRKLCVIKGTELPIRLVGRFRIPPDGSAGCRVSALSDVSLSPGSSIELTSGTSWRTCCHLIYFIVHLYNARIEHPACLTGETRNSGNRLAIKCWILVVITRWRTLSHRRRNSQELTALNRSITKDVVETWKYTRSGFQCFSGATPVPPLPLSPIPSGNLFPLRLDHAHSLYSGLRTRSSAGAVKPQKSWLLLIVCHAYSPALVGTREEVTLPSSGSAPSIVCFFRTFVTDLTTERASNLPRKHD